MAGGKNDGDVIFLGCAVILWWLIVAFCVVCCAVLLAKAAFGW